MHPLDLYTMVIITAVNLTVAGGVMITVWFANRPVPGLRRCGAGTLLLALGIFQTILREVIPGSGIIFLSNVTLCAGGIAVCQGLRAVRGFPAISSRVLYGGAALALSIMAYWLFWEESLNARVTTMSLYYGTLSFLGAVTMAKRVAARDRAIYWTTTAAFGLHGTFLYLRAIQALYIDLGQDLLKLRTQDIPLFFLPNFVIVVAAVGMILVINLKLRREIENLAHYDPLTKLPNRRLFENRLLRARSRSLASSQRFALIYMDLNGFKGINDRLGHRTGDEVLRVVAGRLASTVRDTDCLARIAGDEFVLLVEDVDSRDQVDHIIERLRTAVAAAFVVNGESLALSMSFGAALFPDDVDDVEHLVHWADCAMYEEKSRSRRASVRPLREPKTGKNYEVWATS